MTAQEPTETEPTTIGFDLPRSSMRRLRDGIAPLERSASGNTILRIMRENTPGGPVHQIAHVVITPSEVRNLLDALAE